MDCSVPSGSMVVGESALDRAVVERSRRCPVQDVADSETGVRWPDPRPAAVVVAESAADDVGGVAGVNGAADDGRLADLLLAVVPCRGLSDRAHGVTSFL